MNRPKLVVFDVDGTLVDSTGVCRPSTQEAVAELRSHGVVTAIATGRPLALADVTLALTGPVDWVACGNGTSLLEVATGSLLRDVMLPSEIVEPIIHQLRGRLPGVGFALELARSVLEEADFGRRVPPSPHDPPVVDALAEWHRLGRPGVRKIISYHDEFDDDTAGLAAIVSLLVDPRFHVLHTTLPIVEIGFAGDHKAATLDGLVDHLGFSADDVIAFGDDGNDIEMLQWAGTGVAMGNASPHVKQAADQVTNHVDDEGVSAYLSPILTRLRSDG